MAQGQSIVIKGEISGAEDLVIAGRVEGSIRLAGRILTLADGAQVNGEVSAGSIIVSGTFSGILEATERLDIRNTAVVEGELSTPVIVVADGAQVSATIDMPAREKSSSKLRVAV